MITVMLSIKMIGLYLIIICGITMLVSLCLRGIAAIFNDNLVYHSDIPFEFVMGIMFFVVGVYFWFAF